VLTVRPAVEDDVPALAELFAEMEQFYGSTEIEPIEERERQIWTVVFGDHPAAHVLVAYADVQLVGFASYSFLWPAVGVTKSIYLKELYVREGQRGIGVGKAIMAAVNDVGDNSMCSRVEWTTDKGNQQAQRFYESLNIQANLEKLFYRLSLE